MEPSPKAMEALKQALAKQIKETFGAQLIQFQQQLEQLNNKWEEQNQSAAKLKRKKERSASTSHSPKPEKLRKSDFTKDRKPATSTVKEKAKIGFKTKSCTSTSHTRCFFCQGKGHYSIDCPNKKKFLLQDGGEIVTANSSESEFDVDIKSTSTKEHEEVMQLTSRRTCKGPGRDQLTLVGAERETKAYQWAVTICTLFPYPWFCPNGFYRKGFNEANWFTYLKPIRKLVGSHGDLRSLFESLRPNREELSCELTWSRILIQFWFSSNWIHTKSYFGLKDIKFLTRRILHLPYLELFEFERLQTYIWRPGDNLNLIEASRVQAKSKDLVPFLLFFSFRELSFFGLLVERFVVFVFSFASLVVLGLEP